MSDENLRTRESAAEGSRWRLGRWLMRVALLLSACIAAGPTESRAAEEAAWSPSLGIFGALLINEADGDVRSTLPTRPDASGDDLFLDPALGLTAELMTPTIAARSMSMDMRLLVHADVAVGFGFERSLAREGDAGKLIFPDIGFPPVPNPPPVNINPSEVSGRGSYTKAQLQPWLFFAGAGVSFGFELWDRPVRIKPSLEYRIDKVEVRGLVTEVTGSRTVFPDGSINPDFRQIRIEARDSKIFHSLGPGVELEMDTARVSDFTVSLFVSARAWSVVGDREIEIRRRCCSSTGPEETARWRYERDRWSYASTVGIRFRWSPERSR